MNNQNRTCRGICKKFQVKKPAGASRYGSGHGHCQTCNTWINHQGCHTKDGKPAIENSLGWFCNCCNYRVRQRPRNRIYKEKLKDEQTKNDNKVLYSREKPLDLTRSKIELIKQIAPIIGKNTKNFEIIKIRKQAYDKDIKLDLFDKEWGSFEKFVRLAFEDNPPNKISLMIDFLIICERHDKIPTPHRLFTYSKHKMEDYIKNFGNYSTLLRILGYEIHDGIEFFNFYNKSAENMPKINDDVHDKTQSKKVDEFKTTTNTLSTKLALRSYQINLIKDVAPIIVKYKSSKNHDDIRKEFQANGKSIFPYVKSWKSWIEFIDLAFRDSPPNKISLIIEFERIKNKLGHLPSKLEFYELAKFGIDRYEDEFGSWNEFIIEIGYLNQYQTVIEQLIQEADPLSDKHLNPAENHNLSQQTIFERSRIELLECIKNKPEILEIFTTLEERIKLLSPNSLKKLHHQIVGSFN